MSDAVLAASDPEKGTDRYISTIEAGRLLGIDGGEIYTLIFDGKLPYRRFENWPFVRIPRGAVEDYRRAELRE